MEGGAFGTFVRHASNDATLGVYGILAKFFAGEGMYDEFRYAGSDARFPAMIFGKFVGAIIGNALLSTVASDSLVGLSVSMSAARAGWGIVRSMNIDAER